MHQGHIGGESRSGTVTMLDRMSCSRLRRIAEDHRRYETDEPGASRLLMVMCCRNMKPSMENIEHTYPVGPRTWTEWKDNKAAGIGAEVGHRSWDAS